jgi:transcriptional regulator with XRE-family HTH domain
MNQVVAYNIRRARAKREWTQEDAAQHLEPYLGTLWSKATFSAAERGFETGDRIRQFTADDLIALSRGFDLPIVWFMLPPRVKDVMAEPVLKVGGKRLAGDEWRAALLDTDQVNDRLVEAFTQGEALGTAEYLELVTEIARFGNAALSAAIRARLKDVEHWQKTLHQLADDLGAAATEADHLAAEYVSEKGQS